MEGFPIPESIPTKDEIVERLRAEGFTEAMREVVIKWTEEQERLAQTPRDTVYLNIQRIDFYLAVEDSDGAWECAQEAYENAYREGFEDLCEQIQRIYPGIGL